MPASLLHGSEAVARDRDDRSFDRDEATPDDEMTEDSVKRERAGGPLPEILRRAMTLGLSGFFSTEEAFRRALGDTMPKDWLDFANEQRERTRQEFTALFAHELGRAFERVDIGTLVEQLLVGRSIEVSARIRLVPQEEERPAPRAGRARKRGKARE
jgi:hypothetical protein